MDKKYLENNPVACSRKAPRRLDLIRLLLIYFEQILAKSDQILTIYVKKHSIQVLKIQESQFLEIKNSNVRNQTEFGWRPPG